MTVDVLARAARELARYAPTDLPSAMTMRLVDGVAVVLKALEQFDAKEVQEYSAVLDLCNMALYSLLSPLEESDFDDAGNCLRAITCHKRDGKYYFDLGRVYAVNNRIDQTRPQSVVEFAVPGYPPKSLLYQVRRPCNDCTKPGEECAGCNNLLELR
jgi:hypothetical protein